MKRGPFLVMRYRQPFAPGEPRMVSIAHYAETTELALLWAQSSRLRGNCWIVKQGAPGHLHVRSRRAPRTWNERMMSS